MPPLPCGCLETDVSWETDFTEFKWDGECVIQPGICDCGYTYYIKLRRVAVLNSSGEIVTKRTE